MALSDVDRFGNGEREAKAGAGEGHALLGEILKESLLGVINGAVTGLVTAIVAWLWYGNPALGVVVGLGMIVNLFAAGLAGASIPIGLKSVGLDPAQCSSIVLTTVTDVVGFFAFLGFAVLFVEYLV